MFEWGIPIFLLIAFFIVFSVWLYHTKIKVDDLNNDAEIELKAAKSSKDET